MTGPAYALASAFFWASAVILFKKSGEIFSPLTLNIYKSLVAAVALAATMLLLGIPFVPDHPAPIWLRLSLSGVLGITLADIFFFFALNRLGAARMAAVECLYLPSLLVFSFFLLGEELSLQGLAGGSLILIAVGVGSWKKKNTPSGPPHSRGGIIAGILAMLFLALGIVIAKPALSHTDVFWATFVRVAAGLISLAAMAAFLPKRRQYLAELKSAKAWITAMPASISGNYIALLFWVAGMKYTTASRAAILNQMSTIFIFIMAALFLKERITPQKTCAIVLAMSGAALTISGP